MNLPDIPSEDYDAFKDPNSPFYQVHFKQSRDQPVPTLPCDEVKKDGMRCGNRAVLGMGLDGGPAKCRVHGGKLPNVEKRANAVVEAARLEMLSHVPNAIDTIVEVMQDPSTPEAVRIRAAGDLLDRSGLRPGEQVDIAIEVSTSPAEQLFEKLNSLRQDKPKPELEVLDEA